MHTHVVATVVHFVQVRVLLAKVLYVVLYPVSRKRLRVERNRPTLDLGVKILYTG